jgi:hypothetical protein
MPGTVFFYFYFSSHYLCDASNRRVVVPVFNMWVIMCASATDPLIPLDPQVASQPTPHYGCNVTQLRRPFIERSSPSAL